MDAAVIDIAIFGVWSGSMALAEFRPVDVCQLTIYGLNSGVFLSTLLHMPYPNQGVFWRSSRMCLHAYYPICCLFFCSPGYVHLYVLSAHHQRVDCSFSPPEGMRIAYEGALSRRVHAFT